MPRLTEKDVERISAAIAEPRSFKILKDLAGYAGAMPCSTIVGRHDVSAATISHHLKELEAAGLVEIAREGRFGLVSMRRDVWGGRLRERSARHAIPRMRAKSWNHVSTR
jgi:ArsR family transcriptional regulator